MRPLFLFMSFAAESSYMDDSRASDWLPVEGFQYEALFQRAARLLLCSAVRWCSIIFLESIMGSWGLLMGSSHYILRSLALWNLNLINLLFPIRLNEGFQFNRDVLGFSDDPLLTEKLNLILPQRFVVQSTDSSTKSMTVRFVDVGCVGVVDRNFLCGLPLGYTKVCSFHNFETNFGLAVYSPMSILNLFQLSQLNDELYQYPLWTTRTSLHAVPHYSWLFFTAKRDHVSMLDTWKRK